MQPAAAVAIRERLIEAAEAERQRVRFSDRPSYEAKMIAAGIEAARTTIADLPLEENVSAYLESMLFALEKTRERVARADDEDGWILGGLAWVRRKVEDERAKIGKKLR